MEIEENENKENFDYVIINNLISCFINFYSTNNLNINLGKRVGGGISRERQATL